MQKRNSQLGRSSSHWSSVVWPVSPWLFQVELIFLSEKGREAWKMKCRSKRMCIPLLLQEHQIAASCWTTIDRRVLTPTKKDDPCPRTKEKLQWDGRWSTITLKSNSIPARWVTQTGEQLYQRSSPTVAKSLDHTPDSQTWGARKGTGSPHGILKVSGIWLQNFHRAGGNRDYWRAQTKPCMHQDPGERSSDPRGDWPQTSLWVFEGLLLMCGLAVACHGDRGTSSSSPGRHMLA